MYISKCESTINYTHLCTIYLTKKKTTKICETLK